MMCSIWINRLPLLLIPLMLASCGTSSDSKLAKSGDEVPAIATTSSYLAVAMREIMGPHEPVLVLAEPGMCPGHFDLRPSQVRRLRACDVLLRFDFQQSLDRRVGNGADGTPEIVSVKVPGGMCLPSSYLVGCRRIAEVLIEQERISPHVAADRLSAVEQRLNGLAAWVSGKIEEANLSDVAVVASGHQEAFCRELGLDVVATFSGADAARPSEINEAVARGEQADVQFVIANRPEGRQLADALAERLDAQVVMFANFPESIGEVAFDEMVASNVRTLVEAAR